VKKFFNKDTVKEFLKSLTIGFIPVALDYFFSALVIFFMSDGITFKSLLFGSGGKLASAAAVTAGTVIGYLAGFIAAYLFSVFFVFKHNKKAKTFKGIALFVMVEAFAYGFNVLLAWLLVTVMRLQFTIAYFIRICVSYVVVFSLRKIFVFHPPKETAENAIEPTQKTDEK